MLFNVDLFNNKIFFSFFFLLYFFKKLYDFSSFFGIVFVVNGELFFLLLEFLNFFFKKFGELLFAAMMLINESIFYDIEDAI